ncbi:acyl-CoA dehydrogenase family protein [Mycobacterium sp. NPDC003449]
MSSPFDLLCLNDGEFRETRRTARDFIENDRMRFGWTPAVDSWLSGWDPAFSARLGAEGLLGLTIPTEFGGRGMSHLHRYVVTEELLAAGAPIAAHWMADRQVAPGILAYGSDRQQRELLPLIAAGRLYFAIGLSEDGAGSDLAAAKTRASRVHGGWSLRGTKVWTSGAHVADYIVVLARTSPLDEGDRHAGFSQLLVPREAKGVTVEPIVTMSGEHHFNEVGLDDVFVPDADVLGEIGHGWHQVVAELSYERSGPERILTTAPLIFSAVSSIGGLDPDTCATTALGGVIARMISLRQLSISVARGLSEGRSAELKAALVKDLGTRFEQDSVGVVEAVLADAVRPPELQEHLDTAWTHRPMFTLRGGTNEVLRGMVARGLGLR